MFVLKLLMELGALLILALFLRKVFTYSSGSADAENPVRSARFRGEWQWYSIIYLMLGLILSFMSFWFIYGTFTVLHGIGQYSGVLVVNQGALIVPSLIFGFLGSSIFSKVVYLDLFGMNAAIFEETDFKPRWQRFFRKFFGVFVLAIGVMLLSFQFKVYLKTDGERIYARQMGQSERVYAVDDIKRVAAPNAHQMEIYLRNGDKLSTNAYSGNLNYFLDNLSR